MDERAVRLRLAELRFQLLQQVHILTRIASSTYLKLIKLPWLRRNFTILTKSSLNKVFS